MARQTGIILGMLSSILAALFTILNKGLLRTHSAEAITRHLHTELRYDLGSPSGAAEQPLDHFLFESQRGHCEYFSTALAVLLRAVDVPTRNVTGFGL